MSLAAIFQRHAPGAHAAVGDDERLEAALRALADAGRAAWPALAIDEERFVAHLAGRLPEGADPLGALERTRAAELYLACGCAAGDPAALAAFDAHYLAAVPGYLSGADAAPGFADEVTQAVRTRLLVGSEGQPPRIGRYDGQGPLGGLVRVVATRLAIDLHREQGAAGARGAAVAAEAPLRTAPPDPELDFLKTRYRGEVEAAFANTLAALGDRDANVLNLHFLEGLGADAIGAMYRVSGRTVQRWIAEVRERILAETRRLVGERLRLPAGELDSMMALVQSQLDLSIYRLLKRDGS